MKNIKMEEGDERKKMLSVAQKGACKLHPN